MRGVPSRRRVQTRNRGRPTGLSKLKVWIIIKAQDEGQNVLRTCGTDNLIGAGTPTRHQKAGS